ncbi:unnamed protein product [Rotaria magnacalcarata]|uniref:Protein kinase domain-containing protein n=1 Tax=Rotaria magnacalcarata TaxID=392030 RepID=A0A816PKV4_9BILA|nr:unnamed protein product [Rotaria magnacalcarata]CAF2236798.1 unnamed protein product [Rotaria magnacalcarata]CAF3867428.1 unnamed protein product [Rotaria magnacalcarata]CAF3924503.1 unnamed protein product [Rotaria magnacalcarata]
MASGRISFQNKYRAAAAVRFKQRYCNVQRSLSNDDLSAELSHGETNGNARQRTRHSNWSSLGSLNSFGDSTTTPPSSQGHNGSGASNGDASGGSGASVQKRETLHSRFDFKQTLGKGTYGKVKLAVDKRNNEQVAIKTIKKSRIENPHDLARIRREIDFMTSLNHPNIIKIKEVYESREKIILVMEYASGGELYDYLNRRKRIPESQARSIFRQIVSAVHFLHKNHIVHRDLKLENILIDYKGDIKLADFGLSNSWSHRQLLHTFCGSPLYASPEIVSGTPYKGPEVDCWSLGVLLYTLIFGTMPFQGGDYNRLVRNITSGNFIQPREQSDALNLIHKCLTVSSRKRFNIDDIAMHEWINLGYKRPPADVSIVTKMEKYSNTKIPRGSRSKSNEAPKTMSLTSSTKLKSVQASVPIYSISNDGPSFILPQSSLSKGYETQKESKLKSITNGNTQSKQSNRLKDNKTTKTKKIESLKLNQPNKTIPSPNKLYGALLLIRYCLTPDASLRATTRDILRHEWLATGPVLSLRLNSTTTTPTTPTPTSLSHVDQPSQNEDHERAHSRSTYHEKSISPSNSLVELELHTSSFFDTAKLRDNNLGKNIEQQRRNRVSAIPDSTRYYSSNNTKTNASTSRPTYRRPLSLSLEDQCSDSPINYHYASTSEKPSKLPSSSSSPPPPPPPPPPLSSSLLSTTQPYTRRSRRTVSPTSTKSTSTYGTNDRMTSPPATHRYSLATTNETKPSTSPINPSKYLVSYDFDSTLRDLKRKPIFKHTPTMISPASELNVVPSLSNSTTPIAPSVFTTSAIKFASPPIRRMSPINDQETNANTSLLSTGRLLNNSISNPISNIDNSINTAITNNNRHSLLTLFETNNLRKSRLLDDNNNLISLRVHD